ncbi:glyoxalase [Legionella taurinensis]|uniref:Glyoxalase n=2 Tax=Legionella taurinensis TaxID=70611 RepID=A0A3A5L3E1_9GAMM|nr:glyoxalase [Legionella taurinensis]PUT41600.1 glyoxalase [Legionella taurinensis]PUT44465.1 glyoxalase [Legionella taurinensis]PUT48511.1 glyoxalase [Legionella taurinensis]RJT46294.1 glyoxalase [Legionella taurinensis]
MNAIFHLAFPVHDFNQAKRFYQQQLGFELGRESAHALIFKFGNHQIVGHKVDDPLPLQAGIYPRHFGLIFLERREFDHFIGRLNQQAVAYEIPPKIRFPGTTIEHHSFFLRDPSNNLLEFKHYTYPSAIFAEKDVHQVGESP